MEVGPSNATLFGGIPTLRLRVRRIHARKEVFYLCVCMYLPKGKDPR